ncbi:hypothetical protein LZ30DRAFT_26930 [Colletotrichum cereale]|nr:hypothetical protein LZ30DRAFT_26930 [Colletotrichum cereale]
MARRAAPTRRRHSSLCRSLGLPCPWLITLASLEPTSFPAARNSSHPSCGCSRASGFSCSRTHQGAALGANGVVSTSFRPTSFHSHSVLRFRAVAHPSPRLTRPRRPILEATGLFTLHARQKVCTHAHPCGGRAAVPDVFLDMVSPSPPLTQILPPPVPLLLYPGCWVIPRKPRHLDELCRLLDGSSPQPSSTPQ